MTHRIALLLVTLLIPLVSHTGAAQEPVVDIAPESEAPASSFEFHLHPLVNLVFTVRHYAEQPDDAEIPPAFVDAVTAARDVDETLGFTLLWGLVLADAPTSDSATVWKTKVPDLPETLRLLNGQFIHPREFMPAFIDALVALEPHYLEHVWPAEEQRLDLESERLGQTFDKANVEWSHELGRLLAFDSMCKTVPVYLTGKGPWPGGVTYRFGGEGVCLISLDEIPQPQLVETIIHESIHAHDIADRDRTSALWQFRVRLDEVGVSVREKEARDGPHLLMFFTAAEITRRFFVQDDHVDYGDAAGLYDRLNPTSDTIREPWARWMRGESGLSDTINEMSDAVKATKGDQ